MSARVALPESRLKRKRRIRRTRLSIALGVLLVLLFGGVVGASWIPQLRIKTISVSGGGTLASSTVEAFAAQKIDGRLLFIFPKDNIALYPKKEIESGLLAEYPELESVQVRAENLEAIRITVAERGARALWCGESPADSNLCRLMDGRGFVYAPADENAAPELMRYSGAAGMVPGYTSQTKPMQYLNPEEFTALSALVEALAHNQKETPVASVDVDGESDVRLAFSNNFMILFALRDAKSDVYERFTLALASEPFLNKTINDFEYLDLRFGDKLYYKVR